MNIDPNETIEQLGGRRISSALAYCGVSRIGKVGMDRLSFKVNGRRGFHTYIEIRLMPSDTYNVSLYSYRGHQAPRVFETKTEVYCDEIQSVFETMYDEHMRQYNGNMIPVGAA